MGLINGHLRNPSNSFFKINILGIILNYKQFKFLYSKLDNITNNHKLFEDTILFKGLNNRTGIIEDIIEKGYFLEKGFFSTSFDREVAIEHTKIIYNDEHIKKGWLLEVFCPKNTKGTYLDIHSILNSEKEFLMPRNLKFKLLDIDYKNQVLKIIEKKFLNE